MSMKFGVGAGQPSRWYSARSSRSVPGPRQENITKPSTARARSQRANSAGGSTTACSAMLAHTSCVPPGNAASWSITVGAGERQRLADHQGCRAAASLSAARAGVGSTAMRRAAG